MENVFSPIRMMGVQEADSNMMHQACEAFLVEVGLAGNILALNFTQRDPDNQRHIISKLMGGCLPSKCHYRSGFKVPYYASASG